jgi:peroxiredoxin Q/BCP
MRTTWTSKLKAGDKAPPFHITTQDEQEWTNETLAGKKYIFFFYNHDGSETCTKQACNVRDHFELLSKLGYTIFGVSEDSARKHQKFIRKYDLPYSLIVDSDHTLARAFDIYGKKDFMGRTSDAVHRTTFIIDREGIIESVIHPVDSANHAQQIIDALKANEPV